MAAGHVSKDSWSRCETPSMLYGTMHPPSLPKEPKSSVSVAASVKSKDTMESIQQRIQREMVGKLHHKGLELPHETYVAVVQVGKYLFLAVMLPVYLCCYGIPRWFLTNVLPNFFGVIKNQSFNLGRFVAEMTKQTTDLMKGILNQLLGNALRITREGANDLSKYVSKAIAYCISMRSALLKKIQSRIAMISGDLQKKTSHNIRKAQRSMSEFAFFFGKHMAALSIKFLKEMDRIALRPFVKKFIPPFQWLLRIANIFKTDYERTHKRLNAWLNKIAKPIIQAFNEMLKKGGILSRKVYGKISRPVGVVLMTLKKKSALCLKKMKKTAVDPLIHRISVICAHMKFYMIRIGRLVNKALLVVSAALKRSFLLVWKLVPRLIKEKITKGNSLFSRWSRPLKNFAKEVISRCREVLSMGVKLVLNAKDLFFKLVEFMKRLYRWLFKHLIAVPKKLMSLCVVFFKVLGTIAQRIAFVAQMVIVLIWISLIYSFRLAKQVSKPFIGP